MHSEVLLVSSWVILLVVAIIANFAAFIVAGALILKPVDRSGLGMVLGFFLGPIGLVIAWTIRSNDLLERAEYKERHRAALEETKSAMAAGRPSWAPDEAPRHFR